MAQPPRFLAARYMAPELLREAYLIEQTIDQAIIAGDGVISDMEEFRIDADKLGLQHPDRAVIRELEERYRACGWRDFQWRLQPNVIILRLYAA